METVSIRAFSIRADVPVTGAWSECASAPSVSAFSWMFGVGRTQARKWKSAPRRRSPTRARRLARAFACFAGRRNQIGCGVASPIRILAVDDHPLLREGIAALVNSQPDMKLIAQAANGREAIELVRKHRPDVTLMDLQMPELNGIDAMIAIRG